MYDFAQSSNTFALFATAFAELFGDADFSQIDVDSERTDQIDTFNDYYRAGRSGITIETVANMNNPVHRSLSPEMREAAWVAGQNDLNAVLNDVKGQSLLSGEKVVKNGVQAGRNDKQRPDLILRQFIDGPGNRCPKDHSQIIEKINHIKDKPPVMAPQAGPKGVQQG